jgi:curved DNA-binding protein CbpA
VSEETHYAILGVAENADFQAIRKAHRQLVLRFHPDRTSDPTAVERLMRVNEAYEVLSDRARRSNYDEVLRLRRRRPASEPHRRSTHAHSPPPRRTTRKQSPAEAAPLIAEATLLYSQGKYDAAAGKARQALRIDPQSALAHAILGDIARLREDLRSASRHYAYAVQYDPKNATFQRRYEQVFRQIGDFDAYGKVTPTKSATAALWFAAILSGLMMGYVAISAEGPVGFTLQLVQSWTMGLIVMMFVNGVILGATLSISQRVDRWESVARSSNGRLSQAAMLGLVALVSFWASALLYVFLGLLQNSFTYSISRLITIVAVLALSYALMSALSPTIIWSQTAIWGGNIIYLGALCGWAVADAFR